MSNRWGRIKRTSRGKGGIKHEREILRGFKRWLQLMASGKPYVVNINIVLL